MTLYNLTLGNGTGLLEVTQLVNDRLMFGWFGVMFLLGFSIIMFSAFMFKTNDVGKSMTTTAFIAFTMALSLTALNLMSSTGLFVTVIAVSIAVALTWKK